MAQNKYLIQGPKPELPADPKDWVRISTVKPRLADDVDRAIASAAEALDGKFTVLLTGRQKSEYVHGSKCMDQAMATQIVMAEAAKLDLRTINERNMAEVSRCISTVMAKRFGKGRNQLIRESRVLIEHAGGGNPGHDETSPPGE